MSLISKYASLQKKKNKINQSIDVKTWISVTTDVPATGDKVLIHASIDPSSILNGPYKTLVSDLAPH